MWIVFVEFDFLYITMMINVIVISVLIYPIYTIIIMVMIDKYLTRNAIF
jgi:hypothetical protein